MPATTDAAQTPARQLVRRIMAWDPDAAADWTPLVEREWLVTNGLGGYASGTVSGAASRRYHGLLVAAFPAPLGRVLMLADLVEELRIAGGRQVRLGGEETPAELALHGARWLTEFRLEAGLPVWVYELGGVRLEKRLLLCHGQNTVIQRYEVTGGEAELRVRPLIHFRSHDDPVDAPLADDHRLERCPDGIEVCCGGMEELPPLRLRGGGESVVFREEPTVWSEVLYRVEAHRGYPASGRAWSPGFFAARLSPASAAGITASAEPWPAVHDPLDPEPWSGELRRRGRLLALAGAVPPEPQDEEEEGGRVAAELVLAADQFVIVPARVEDAARSRSAGEEPRSIIAGYHWFTDWGRDTMISLEGLTLATGRHREAAEILRTFALHVREGLIPNLFPEGRSEGLYHTADATLWFFHALDRYRARTGDDRLLEELLPRLREVIDWHLRGTRFGIGVDPADQLLRQGAEGYQLTWMDAKVGDWVVTPRRGKAVEINALWYNALRLMESWERDIARDASAAAALEERAERVHESFNARFWHDDGGYLLDVVDGESGDDPAFRPNQVFAVSLPHPVLRRDRWEAVMEKVRERLLTPVGLRSLDPGHPDYRPRYFGDLRTRDAAYHQGTVWGWLIGPYVDAWLRVHPEAAASKRELLSGLVEHLGEAGLGTLSEIFDAEPPHAPRGCVAQAWTVAEVTRHLLEEPRRVL